MNKSKPNSYSFLFPVLNIYYILANAFNGFIFVFFRFPVLVYQFIAFKLDKTYRHFTTKNSKPVISTAQAIKEKKKNFHYSLKTMQRMNDMKEKLEKELKVSESRSKEQILFYYKAMNPDGEIVSGTMRGYAKNDIYNYLLNKGFIVYTIQSGKKIDFLYGDQSISLFQSTMSVNDLLFWLTQLSTYLKSGITLPESMEILSKQMGKKNKRIDRCFKEICNDLDFGQNFSDALARQGKMFPNLLVNMIRAAEATGTITETLEDMANYYQEVDRTKKQMKSALTYPIIIMVFAVAVITFILVYIIPQFTDIFEDAGLKLSGITLFIVNASDFLKEKWLTLIILFCGVVIGLYALYSKILSFKTITQAFLMKIPIIGDVIIYNEVAIFTKTFASLLKNNVYITDSMNILTKITNNEIYKDIMYSTIDNIIKGNKISEAFKDHWAVPDAAYFMIVTGESTGELPEMMNKVSVYFQEMHSNKVNSLKSLIEPITIVLLAIIVGVIVISIIVPMFSLYNELS